MLAADTPASKQTRAQRRVHQVGIWRPRIVGRYQGAKVQLAKFAGDFVWHKHDETDDSFLVLKGHLLLDLPDRTVELSAGDMFIVPAGVEHRPRALDDVHVLNLEASGTVNTGDADDPGVLQAPEQLLPKVS